MSQFVTSSLCLRFVVTINIHLLTSFYTLLFMCIMFVGDLPAFFAQHQKRKEELAFFLIKLFDKIFIVFN